MAANAGLPLAKNGGQTARNEFFSPTLIGIKPLEMAANPTQKIILLRKSIFNGESTLVWPVVESSS